MMKESFVVGGVKVTIEVPDAPVMSVLPPSHFSNGSHKCPDSVTGRCVYTRCFGDDCCIFCGEPNERK